MAVFAACNSSPCLPLGMIKNSQGKHLKRGRKTWIFVFGKH